MHTRRWTAGLLATVALSVAVAGAAPVAAQARVAGALVANPALAEFSLTPGSNFADQITLENRTREPLRVFATTGNIEPAGNGFAYRPPSTTTSVNSAAAWITLSPSIFELPAGSTATVAATIRVPIGSPVGGHYAAVQFAATTPDSRSIEGLHVILIEVPGVGLTRAGRVLGVTMPRLEINGEIPFTVQVENGGNTHLRVGGTLTIRDRIRRRTVGTVEIPQFYVLPGTTTGHTVVWRDPPLVALANARVHLNLVEACNGPAAAACEARTSGVITHWWIIAGAAVFLLLLRLLIGLISFRRRLRDRRAPAVHRQAAEPAMSHEVSATPPQRLARAWEHAPPMGPSIALRRANSALRMLREGAGETGVRLEVALGLLRSVREAPDVPRAVEAAYTDAAQRSQREAAALALALHEVDSAHAPEALLRGYAKADRVLAQRIKRALAECDPADLRAHRDLLDALPSARRATVPIA